MEQYYIYIRNINEETSKIADNIKFYSVAIDDKKDIHICCVNSEGNLLHIYNIKNNWRRKLLFRYKNSIENIKDIKLHLIDDTLNIFLLENSSLSSTLFHVTHINKNINKKKLSINEINNVIYENNTFYKIDIDEDNNIRFEYNCLDNRRSRRKLKLFNNKSKTWSDEKTLEVEGVVEKEVPSNEPTTEVEYPIQNINTPSIENKRNVRNKKYDKNNQNSKFKADPTIKDDLLFYCNTINYKK